mmetsp:Transcript_26085/g.51999  ORF Transcript_26085/g.51999 Transcript_26085/m.51999 type:complete len:227 (-) Transcript_26085:204-884(-)|eukprot:CAMPEP_0194342106 /NCGR_PEP_ID=MMETSP0171-20130528/91828_1 /TAXON_ID=218684 /ORGANISM="Corethron pennatum, Strain L29A3" /LENGTH=226 /DNA_ID=CAMNT_0039107701 /DNA_START=29 /DNA_END=709 /DNA_ORIENTATION=+
MAPMIKSDHRSAPSARAALFFIFSFVVSLPVQSFAPPASRVPLRRRRPQCRPPAVVRLANIYDSWRSDAVVPTSPLCEEMVLECLEEFVESDYGQQMFGVSDLAASYGITGRLDFVAVEGPEVILALSGKFWHRRETVLGRAATWLNARIPEVATVSVEEREMLEDFRDYIDEFTGELLYVEDKRSADFNGDRETMEYQGIDPDMRGPFPQGVGGLRPGGSMINPA